MSVAYSVFLPWVSWSISAMKLRRVRLSSGVRLRYGCEATLRKSGIMCLVSILRLRRNSGAMISTWHLKLSDSLLWASMMFFGPKTKSESLRRQYSCRLSDTLASPSVPMPMMMASMRQGKRNSCICDEVLTAMHPLSKPSRYCGSPERATSSVSVKLVIGASEFGLFGISQKFRQI